MYLSKFRLASLRIKKIKKELILHALMSTQVNFSLSKFKARKTHLDMNKLLIYQLQH